MISLVILPKDFFPSVSKPKISCSNYIRFIQSKVYKLNQKHDTPQEQNVMCLGGILFCVFVWTVTTANKRESIL